MKTLKTFLGGILFSALFCGVAWGAVVEKFEDGNLDNWAQLEGTWRVVRGIQTDGAVGNVLQVRGFGLDSQAALISYRCGSDWTDYTFEADVKMDRGSDYSMAWRSLNTGEYYVEWSNGWLRAAWNSYTGRQWNSFGYYRWNWEYGKWYHIKVVLNGPNQKFFIDGRRIFDINSDAYDKNGTIHFKTVSSYMSVDNVVVSGVRGCTPAFIPVTIDVKPGSDANSVNINSKGVIPVAVPTTESFDSGRVDPETVRFGPFGAYPEHYAMEDIDGDGDFDLVLHFRTRDTGIAPQDTEAGLTGKTYEGLTIEGRDSVNVIAKGKK